MDLSNASVLMLALVLLPGCAYKVKNAPLPDPMVRDEVLENHYVAETPFRLSQRVSHRECGYLFLPLPPVVVPADYVHRLPAVVSIGASPNQAYEAARETAGADFLVDVKEEWDNTLVLFIFGQKCVTVSGMAAHLQQK